MQIPAAIIGKIWKALAAVGGAGNFYQLFQLMENLENFGSRRANGKIWK